jgi:hypothetical protein
MAKKAKGIILIVMNENPASLTVRVGCDLVYEASVRTPVLFVLKPRHENGIKVLKEKFSFGVGQPAHEFPDSHGNLLYRSVFLPGAMKSGTMRWSRFLPCPTVVILQVKRFRWNNCLPNFCVTLCPAAIVIPTS